MVYYDATRASIYQTRGGVENASRRYVPVWNPYLDGEGFRDFSNGARGVTLRARFRIDGGERDRISPPFRLPHSLAQRVGYRCIGNRQAGRTFERRR